MQRPVAYLTDKLLSIIVRYAGRYYSQNEIVLFAARDLLLHAVRGASEDPKCPRGSAQEGSFSRKQGEGDAEATET